MDNNNRFIGQVGLGYWGKNLLRNLYQLKSLRWAYDISPTITSARAKEFPDVEYATSVQAIFQDPEIKGVAIATPASTHYQLVKQALLAEKE